MHFRFVVPLVALFLGVIGAAEEEPQPRVYDRVSAQWTILDVEEESHRSLDFKPYPSEVPPGNAAIFIGVTSYRDTRCGETVFDAFRKSDLPYRVTVGIVQQNHRDDVDCLAHFCALASQDEVLGPQNTSGCPFLSNIRVMNEDYSEARGPIPARYDQQALVQREDFCLQIDAHTRFVPKWDTALITEWARTDNEYGMLTTHAPPVSEMTGDTHARPSNEVPHLCHVEVSPSGVLRNGVASAAVDLQKPLLGAMWDAGFSFSKCHAETTVRNDPSLAFFDEGEDFARAVRLWTHGYDFYTPSRTFVYHSYAPRAAQEADQLINTETTAEHSAARVKATASSTGRMQSLVGWGQGQTDTTGLRAGEAFALGRARSLSAFLNFTGVDSKTKTAAGRCGQLYWTPYDNAPLHSSNEQKQAFAHAEEVLVVAPGILEPGEQVARVQAVEASEHGGSEWFSNAALRSAQVDTSTPDDDIALASEQREEHQTTARAPATDQGWSWLTWCLVLAVSVAGGVWWWRSRHDVRARGRMRSTYYKVLGKI